MFPNFHVWSSYSTKFIFKPRPMRTPKILPNRRFATITDCKTFLVPLFRCLLIPKLYSIIFLSKICHWKSIRSVVEIILGNHFNEKFNSYKLCHNDLLHRLWSCFKVAGFNYSTLAPGSMHLLLLLHLLISKWRHRKDKMCSLKELYAHPKWEACFH